MLRFAIPLFLVLGGCATNHRVHELQAQIDQKDAQIEQLTDENRGYMLQADDLREQVAKLDKKNQKLAAWYDGVLATFGPELDKGQIQLVVYPDRTSLEMPEGVYFDSGSAKLTDDGKATVASLATLMLEYPERRFVIEGHTDPQPVANGPYDDNWALGSARSLAVVRELVRCGVPEDRLSAMTYADTSPMASNATAEGWARNRRIAVSIQPLPEESGQHLALYERAKDSNRFVAADGVKSDRPPVASK